MKRSNEVKVGILITAALTVLVLGTLWLARGGLSSGYPLYTRFPWGQNLKQGQPVLLAGVNVGYVGDVQLRRAGYLDVMIRVNNEHKVPKGSKATVQAIGIFGDVAVALTPPVPTPADDYAPGDTVPMGTPAPSMNEILGRVDSIGGSVAILLKSIQAEVVDAGTLKDVHKAVASAAVLSTQLQGVITEQNKNLTTTMQSFANAANHMSNALDSAQVHATLENLQQTTANATKLVSNLDSTNAQLKSLLAQAEHGNGTVGKLMSDEALYTDIRQTMTNLNALLADFKANPKKYINLRIF